MPSPAPLLDYDELAEYLGTTRRNLENLVYRRKIPYLKVGRLVRFDLDEIGEWLDAQRVPVAS